MKLGLVKKEIYDLIFLHDLDDIRIMNPQIYSINIIVGTIIAGPQTMAISGLRNTDE